MLGSWQTGYIETNGIRLHYTRTGGTKPPIVLAHGFSDDGLCWTPVAVALAADYDVVMLDARGHGRSDAPPEGYGAAEHAADLLGAITALGLQGPAVLGHSMGAATALALGGTYPGVPGAILLEDPPAWWTADTADAQSRNEWLSGMRAWITSLKQKTREELIAEQRRETPGWSEAELGPWADSKLRFNLAVLGENDATPVEWHTILARITCPALLITADAELGSIITDESAAALNELVPHLRIAHIPMAGHSIRRDQFERYLTVVRGFLAETRLDS